MNPAFSFMAAALLTPVLTTSSAFADTLHVSVDFPTIQAAIDAAVDGDEVVVADGTYTGPGNRDMDFGGRAITVRSENGAAACVIDIQASALDPHRAFFFHSSETTESVVEGFTIQNGFMARGGAVRCNSSPLFRSCVFQQNTARPVQGDDGGGAVYNFGYGGVHPTFIDCQFIGNHAEGASGGAMFTGHLCEVGTCASATLIGCQFSGNTATGRGGAIFTDNGGTSLSDCTFEGNQADSGGAIDVSSATLYDCEFHDNVATMGGGAIRWHSSGHPGGLIVANCRFIGNTAAGTDGGAIIGFRGAIVNCLFQANHAVGSGGGLNVGHRSSVVNTTFSGNTASSGSGIAYTSGDDHTLSNSIVWEDSPDGIFDPGVGLAVTYSNIQGGWPGVGNIDADPLFVDPDNGDLRLSVSSPCIDAGDNTAVPENVTTDLDGNPRFVDDPNTTDTGNPGEAGPPIVDMGAYELQLLCPEDIIGDGVINVLDLIELLLCFGQPAVPGCEAEDVNGDGTVNVLDLIDLLLAFGTSCP